MSRFTCPDCGGGFPEPAIPGDDPTESGCPWCGYTFDSLKGVISREPRDDYGPTYVTEEGDA